HGEPRPGPRRATEPQVFVAFVGPRLAEDAAEIVEHLQGDAELPAEARQALHAFDGGARGEGAEAGRELEQRPRLQGRGLLDGARDLSLGEGAHAQGEIEGLSAVAV